MVDRPLPIVLPLWGGSTSAWDARFLQNGRRSLANRTDTEQQRGYYLGQSPEFHRILKFEMFDGGKLARFG